MGRCQGGRAIKDTRLESHEDFTVTAMPYLIAVESAAVREPVSSALEAIGPRSCQQDRTVMDSALTFLHSSRNRHQRPVARSASGGAQIGLGPSVEM